jgi:uncharacterized protein
MKKMRREDVIKTTEEFVREKIIDYDSGHDWWHIERVRKLALFINEEEGIADQLTVEVTALLHDYVDSKFSGTDIESGFSELAEFMDNNGLTDRKDQILNAIRDVSFSKKNPSGNLSDPVLLIVQDADRLDAIGAIGIARAFNYGGFRNNIIYNPVLGNKTPSTINHFYEKLLLLKYRMNTLTAKKLAAERHEFLEIFLKQFYKEWEFRTGEVNS